MMTPQMFSRRGLFSLPAGLGATALGRGAFAAAPAPRTRARRISPEIYKIAKRWAAKRQIPLQWVLATILAESEGDPYARGDKRGNSYRSLGLMQINRVAFADLLPKFGVTDPGTQLFDPDTNVMIGTYLIREAWARVYKALVGRPAPGPLHELVRFSYVGPTPTDRALRSGKHPKEIFSDGPLVASAWARAISETKAIA